LQAQPEILARDTEAFGGGRSSAAPGDPMIGEFGDAKLTCGTRARTDDMSGFD